MLFAGRKHVDDAAAGGKFPVLLGGVLSGEPGRDKQLGEVRRRDFPSGLELDRKREQTRRRADPRQERRGRRDDGARRPGRDRVQRAGARRAHAEVRRQAAVGIDLVGGKRQDRPFGGLVGQSFERRQKEPGVGDGWLELRVGRHDHQHDPGGPGVGRGGHEERLGRRAQTGHVPGRRIETAPGDGGFQDGPKVQRGRSGHD